VKSDVALTTVQTAEGAPFAFVDASLYCTYVYLDTEERRKFAQQLHEYLIEQLQFTGDESIPASLASSTNKVRLSFNHPVKELVWFINLDVSSQADTKNGNMIFDWGEKDSVDYVQNAKLLLNGHERFSSQPGSWFRLVALYFAHPRVPNQHVYIYSFALEPSAHQPSGTTNFSRIDNAQLHLTFKPNMPAARCKIFAQNYNVLRIMSTILLKKVHGSSNTGSCLSKIRCAPVDITAYREPCASESTIFARCAGSREALTPTTPNGSSQEDRGRDKDSGMGKECWMVEHKSRQWVIRLLVRHRRYDEAGVRTTSQIAKPPVRNEGIVNLSECKGRLVRKGRLCGVNGNGWFGFKFG
jgi:hypothetical protein